MAGCSPEPPPPPPSLTFQGLPVSGSLKDAVRAGFGGCVEIALELRCRRDNVKFFGQGPFSAAVDLAGSDGASGFRQLTLWHDGDQNAVFAITRVLQQQGWRYCYTGEENWGDQAIYTRDDVPFFMSMDISYWGKRRLRVLPRAGDRADVCASESKVEQRP
ncbi:hypothetical protein IP88_04040 [alpha proteobacterium AAP81b]|nr:hypothetical protein IP88_04040 [alpha proteobacterium AAP81b]